MRMPRLSRLTVHMVALVLVAFFLAACGSSVPQEAGSDRATSPSGEGNTLTLAFAGDVHFQGSLAGLLEDLEATLGPMAEHLEDADLAMVNLESALTEGGQRTDKELEKKSRRYWFRAPPAALELLDRSGVDVVTVANNHGADFGVDGLEETLAAAEDGPVAIVGVGEDADEAFTPHRVTIRETDVAVLAADAAPRESEDPIWAAGEGGPGIASAREDPPERLVAAVEEADGTDDLVVVYLHWGSSGEQCPTDQQRQLAETLSSAGADVVVGSHAHVLLGAGMLEDTYIAYGLGNFLWYNASQRRTGVLKVHVTDALVVADEFVPARIPRGGGQPQPVPEDAREAAHSEWEDLRGCTDLEAVAGAEAADGGRGDGGASTDADEELPAYAAEVRQIGPSLRKRMSSSHDPDRCPVDLADLRHLTLSHVGFDGRHHTGEMVVHADHAEDVVGVFEELYEARWPIRRMRLIDEYDADDDRSMADDNTSAYNCRRVAGKDTWSAHAHGAAIDINPVENPYVVDGEIRPPDGRRFASIDRSADAETPPGVIQQGDVVNRAFERIGWTWGGTFSEPDYQHFAAR